MAIFGRNSQRLPQKTPVPRHVAIVMDGNGRWAKQHKLPRTAGHKAGVDTLRKLILSANERGIEVLTVFAFSSENWSRPIKEVKFLFGLFVKALQREIEALHEQNVQLKFIGNRFEFASKLQRCIKEAESLTLMNTALKVRIAANYGGRWDILNATKSLMQAQLDGKITIDDVNESLFKQHMSLANLPEPDLFIRTSGERRLSNFLLWDLAYTEMYFTDTLWPDFSLDEFNGALSNFQLRERRFGLISEQVDN